MVTGYEKCEKKAVCAHKTASTAGGIGADKLVSFGDFCPGQADGTMCCGPEAARTSVGSGYAVNYNTIDIYDAGAGLKPVVSHVVDLDIQIKYTPGDPSRLKAEITVPFVTTKSYVNMTVANGGHSYSMCPSMYLIDLKEPLEGKPTDAVMGETSVRGTSADPWLPLTYLPTKDAFGRPRSTCSNYDFTLQTTTSGLLADLDYPDATGSATKLYGDVPTFLSAEYNTASELGMKAWPSVIDDPTSPGDGLTPGVSSTPFWTKSTPTTADMYDQKITYATGNWDIVRGWRGCKATSTGEDLVRDTLELEDQVVNGVAYPVTTYSWVWHICQVGRYGAGGQCGALDPVITYAKACTTRPASFSLSPQQISDVEVTPLDATTTAKVFLQSVVGSQNENSGCSAGQERYVITMNLVYFESATNSKVATGGTELVHDIVSPVGTSGIFDVANDLVVTEIGTGATNNVEQFLTVMRGGSPMTEGIYLLEEEALTDTSADFYRYQKVILLTKCYNTEVDAARGTRGNPNALVVGLGLATADDSVLLQTKLVTKNSDNTKRTTLDLRILASQESFKLPDAESMTAKEVQAEQTLYGSYEQARTNLGSVNGVTFTTQNPLKPGAQICSKHQIEDSHAAVAHLSVNSVGACLVSDAIQQIDVLKELAGTSVEYIAAGMRSVQKYTFGCFSDWIDVTEASQQTCSCTAAGVCNHAGCTDGGQVFIFSDQVKRLTNRPIPVTALAASYWFVSQEALNQVVVASTSPPQTISELFGTALF